MSEFCRRKHWLAESSQRFLPLKSKVALQAADKWTQRQLVGGQRALSAETTAQLMHSPSCQADPEGGALLVRKWYGSGRLEFCPPEGPQDRRVATFLDRQSRAYIRMLDEFYRTAFGAAASLTHLKLRGCRKWSAAVELPRALRFGKLQHVDVSMEALRLMVNNLTPNDTKPWRRQQNSDADAAAVPALCPEAETLQLSYSRFGRLTQVQEDYYRSRIPPKLSANFPKVRDFETPDVLVYFTETDGRWSSRVLDNIAVSSFVVRPFDELPILQARQTLNLFVPSLPNRAYGTSQADLRQILTAEIDRQLAQSPAQRVYILLEPAPEQPSLDASAVNLVASLLDAHGDRVDIAVEGESILVRDSEGVFENAELQTKYQRILLHLTTPRKQAVDGIPPPWPPAFCARFDRAKTGKRLAYCASRLPRRLVAPTPLAGINSGGVQIRCAVEASYREQGFDLLFSTPNACSLIMSVFKEVDAQHHALPQLEVVARSVEEMFGCTFIPGAKAVASTQFPQSTARSPPSSHGLAMSLESLPLYPGPCDSGEFRDPLHTLLEREGFHVGSTEVRMMQHVETAIGGTANECPALTFARLEFPTVLREVKFLSCSGVANLVQLAQHVTYQPSKAQHVLNMFRNTFLVRIEETPASRDHIVALRRSIAVALPGLKVLQLTCPKMSVNKETVDRRREALGLRGDQTLMLTCVPDNFW